MECRKIANRKATLGVAAFGVLGFVFDVGASAIENSSSRAILVSQEVTLEALYGSAERYIEAFCRKKGLDAQAENRKWLRRWTSSLTQAIKDDTDGSEQSYINRILLAKRDCFNMDKTAPEKTVEACRIMLRYRDAGLSWPSALRNALTPELMLHTLQFLSAGPR